ncbi:MAG: hypothetical protein LT070_02595 [Solirubrobacteraceae bacterium]|nr:hypothetical protein [Solirubrobacteraceae bacterium]
MWIHVADRPHSVQRFLWRERHVTAVPVRTDGRLCQWLVLVASRDGASAPATSIVEAAGNVLGAAASTARIRAARERMEGAQLVDLLMSPDREPDAEALRPRLAAAGLDFTDDVCAIHVAPRPATPR